MSDTKEKTSPINHVNTETKRERPQDIRSFFSATTAPRSQKNKLITSSSSSSTKLRCRSPLSDSSHRISTPRKRVKKQESQPPMSQLLLDISNRPTTQTCKECGMSFVLGVPEDIDLHKKHHRQVVEGLEWTLNNEDYYQSECRTVWNNSNKKFHEEEKIIKINLNKLEKLKKLKIKINPILNFLNFNLGAQELTNEQLSTSSLYLYIGSPNKNSDQTSQSRKRKRLDISAAQKKKEKSVVKAMCVAARIEYSYQIVPSPHVTSDSKDPDLDDLLRFGDTTTELFCSKTRETSLIGIHRIWTSSEYRGAGLGKKLLDAVALTFIYGMPITRTDERLKLIAFSQPTHSGFLLASKWLHSLFFRIFVD